ncbi:MAG: NAD-dependent deacetylase [Sulfurovum sp.]|nr:NAD-dependent deacetylase [Sulfurovum sp.]
MIAEADAIIISAGAGMGVDSGLPDFRGNSGFWEAYPAAKELDLSFVELANPEWFDRDPMLAWAFYGHRLNLYRNTMPHDGFRMLLELALQKRDYFIFTSNVDGQFQQAGFDEDRVYECHGSIKHFQCTKCSHPIYSAKDMEVRVNMEEFRALDIPLCPNCDSVARPNILMFGDWGWDNSRAQRQSQQLEYFLKQLQYTGSSLVIVEIGAGEHIPTVRHFSEETARATSSFVVRINPRDYHIDKDLGVGITVGGLDGIRSLLIF